MFEELDGEFHFDLDPCADSKNHKCNLYYTKEQDGLKKDWQGHTVFCNPPYGRKKTAVWMKKCAEEAKKPGTKVVMLVPARTDTIAFHEYVWNKAEIRFLKGRLKFEVDGKEHKDPAPFPSMVVIFRPEVRINESNL
ncbi:phage N-6-adenine-methyltransferase [Faecalicatena contorta]|uniref:Phage N-6-adenine-methyltransferase n=1 Tax=Faecalicatena contorta TaxID=39482 RepID=A0A315ZVT2_9FIRM|nr:phage N-6-adenine-methyltransferase [Faecalicatena contorta]SUQ14577.1 phage N-6-adenine-methyltransferase [Faecalicatena contorta]